MLFTPTNRLEGSLPPLLPRNEAVHAIERITDRFAFRDRQRSGGAADGKLH